MMMYFKKIILAATCMIPIQLLFAQLPQDSRRAGGIAVIPLSTGITQVSYEGKAVLISKENEQHYAVFGIPLSAQVGTLTLNTNKNPIQIEIKPYRYAEQRLNVKNKDYVNPNQEQLDRYAREAKNKMIFTVLSVRVHGHNSQISSDLLWKKQLLWSLTFF